MDKDKLLFGIEHLPPTSRPRELGGRTLRAVRQVVSRETGQRMSEVTLPEIYNVFHDHGFATWESKLARKILEII